MSCTPSSNIINIEFSLNDELNWQYQSANTIHTINDKLFFNPENDGIIYKRELGAITPTNDKLKFQLYFENETDFGSITQNVNLKLKTNGGLTIYDETIVLTADNGKSEKYLKRQIDIDNINDDVYLELNISGDYQKGLYFKYLILDQYEFCKENLRTYFTFENDNEDLFGLFQTAFAAQLKMKQWKIENAETLTPIFFTDNDNKIAQPLNDWYFAKSDDDGKNREHSILPTLFNPFIYHLGLKYDNANYYSGLPTGTTNGNDYGQGIMKIGTELPIVKDVIPRAHKGIYFIDIDYTKDLHIEFDLIVNTNSQSLYQNPDIYRTYVIDYKKDICQTQYYYIDNITNQRIDLLIIGKEKGFLRGETAPISKENNLNCNFKLTSQGKSDNLEKTIDVVGKGWYEVSYEFYDEPNRLILDFGGTIYDTKFKGKSSFNQALINLGINQSDIATANPSNGNGLIRFYVNTTTPVEMKLALYNLLKQSNDWYLFGRCPKDVIWKIAKSNGTCTGYNGTWQQIYFQNPNEVEYDPAINDVVYSDELCNVVFDGNNEWHKLSRTYNSGSILTKRYRINSLGIILDIDC